MWCWTIGILSKSFTKCTIVEVLFEILGIYVAQFGKNASSQLTTTNRASALTPTLWRIFNCKLINRKQQEQKRDWQTAAKRKNNKFTL